MAEARKKTVKTVKETRRHNSNTGLKPVNESSVSLLLIFIGSYGSRVTPRCFQDHNWGKDASSVELSVFPDDCTLGR